MNDSPPFATLVSASELDPDFYRTVPMHWVIGHLNNLPGVDGYIFRTYSPAGGYGRQYFSAANALRIDAIRGEINRWWEKGLLTEPER